MFEERSAVVYSEALGWPRKWLTGAEFIGRNVYYRWGYYAMCPDRAPSPSFAGRAFASPGPWRPGLVPSRPEADRAERIAEFGEAPPATALSTARARRLELSCAGTAAERFPTCSRSHGYGFWCPSSGRSVPIPANPRLSARGRRTQSAAGRCVASRRRGRVRRRSIRAVGLFLGSDRSYIGQYNTGRPWHLPRSKC